MYTNYNSIQDFCDEIDGNDEVFSKTPADKTILVILNSLGVGFTHRYAKILRERVYSYVPNDLLEFYNSLENKPFLTMTDYQIIEKLKQNKRVEAKDFQNFQYDKNTNSFNLFIKYEMAYENMRQFTDDVQWLIKSKDCTFEIAKELTDDLQKLSKFPEFKAYLCENPKKYLDYKIRPKTVKYVSEHFLDFKDFITENSKYFKDLIERHYSDFKDFIVDNYSDYKQCIFNNFYQCPEFEVAMQNDIKNRIPIKYLLTSELYNDAKYFNYVAKCIEDPNASEIVENNASKLNDENQNDSDIDDISLDDSDEVSDDESGNESGSESGSADSGSADSGSADSGSADSGSADSGSADSGSAENKRKKNDTRDFYQFLLKDNSINVKKNNFSTSFKVVFDKYFHKNLKKFIEFNKELTIKKIICMRYQDLYNIIEIKENIGNDYTMAMYYVKIFQEEPPYILRHEPTISYKKISIGKAMKPFTILEAWKANVGDISIPLWMKSHKSFQEMIMKHDAEATNIKTIGDAEFIVLYQTQSDVSNNLPYYKFVPCTDIGKKIRSQDCKSARVFIACMCPKDTYLKIKEVLDDKYKYNLRKKLYTGNINEICKAIQKFI